MTPMDRPEYVRIKFSDIPKEFVDEYDLTNHIHNGWVYFEIVRGCYGLLQSGKLANKAGYYEAVTTMGLWRHKWRPIMFVLIVDDFGIEYGGDQHVQHLQKVLQEHYEITTDWEGEKFAGINIEWNYAKKHSERSCRLYMKKYISNILIKHDHPMPLKPQLSPHKHREIQYGAIV